MVTKHDWEMMYRVAADRQDRLEAENARLREALEWLEREYEAHPAGHYARAALKDAR